MIGELVHQNIISSIISLLNEELDVIDCRTKVLLFFRFFIFKVLRL